MNAVAAPRRAALMAHALAKDDQAWLLSSLPPAGRSVLEPLLIELQDLGIPPDASLLDALAADAAPAAPPSPADALAALRGEEVRVLARVLQQEDPQVAARLLACRSWPWRHALVAAMERDFADRVRESAGQSRAPALDTALCHGLLAEVRCQPRTGRRSRRDAIVQGIRRAFLAAGARA